MCSDTEGWLFSRGSSFSVANQMPQTLSANFQQIYALMASLRLPVLCRAGGLIVVTIFLMEISVMCAGRFASSPSSIRKVSYSTAWRSAL